MTLQRILVVDDESLAREYLAEAVTNLGYSALTADSAEAALKAIEAEQPDVVMTDLRMPDMDGVELTRQIQERWPDLPVLMCTAHATIETAVEAMKHGARDVLLKPVSIDRLELVLEAHPARAAPREDENRYLRPSARRMRPDESIAASSRHERAPQGRRARRPLQGHGPHHRRERHRQGARRPLHPRRLRAGRQPFIRVNCAALSEQLLESELFGHERGAFTSADNQRLGRFELADGGTLLLDEVGEISSAMQAKLLRVLEEDEFERVGGQKTLKVDVRVIASTNRDLAQEVAAGRFREDLYYRLHVLPLHIAPLNERARRTSCPSPSASAQMYAAQNGIETPTALHGGVRAARRLGLARQRPRAGERHPARAVILAERPSPVFEITHRRPASSDRPRLQDHRRNALDMRDPAFQEAIANNTMADVERVAILSTLRADRR